MIIGRPTAKPVLWLGDPDDTAATMRVTSPYAQRGTSFHAALDIGNYVAGDALVACADATVLAVGYLGAPWSSAKPSDAWWYAQPAGPASGQRVGLYGPPSKWVGPTWGGLMTVLNLGSGYVAVYAHQRDELVTVGQRVSRGQLIGHIGDTGSAHRQPHLHFGIRYAGAIDNGHAGWVDPWPLINGVAHPHLSTAQEDDVQIKGKFLRHVANRRGVLTVDSHLRAGVLAGADASLIVLPAGTPLYPIVVVDGRAVGTSADRTEWYGALAWVSGPGYVLGYVHSSVLPRSTDGSTVALQRIEATAGYSEKQLGAAERTGLLNGGSIAITAFTSGGTAAAKAAIAKATEPA